MHAQNVADLPLYGLAAGFPKSERSRGEIKASMRGFRLLSAKVLQVVRHIFLRIVATIAQAA